MYGLNSIFPFVDEFLILSLIMIFLSLILFIIFIISKYKLMEWIENYKDEQIKQLDELDFKRCKEGMRNTYNLFILSLIIYIFMYILQ